MPFHSWTPDVYQGAPTPVTGFMAACTKVAAFGALLRVFYVGVGRRRWDWQPMLWVVAILTMVVGSVLAGHPDRRQADAGLLLDRPRRLHPRRRAGLRPGSGVVRACCSTSSPTASPRIGAFAVVTLVRDTGGRGDRTCRSGPGSASAPRWSPAIFALFLLAFAGIPLTSGFIGKFAVFAAGRRARAALAGS